MLMKKCMLTWMVFFLFAGSYAQEDSTLVLPSASLAFFQVQAVDKVVLLKWSVEQTEDLKSFDIERAEDGLHFNKIGSKLAISKSANQDYDFVDATPKKNTGLRYRLKLISKDGFVSYSDFKETKMQVEQLVVRLKQNPVRSSIDIEVNASAAQEASVAIVSQAGQQVASQTVRLSTGANQLSLSTQSLLQGIYRLVVDTGSERKTLSFIKE
jgi:hypothetical protein